VSLFKRRIEREDPSNRYYELYEEFKKQKEQEKEKI